MRLQRFATIGEGRQLFRGAILGEHIAQRGLLQSRSDVVQARWVGAREDLGHDPRAASHVAVAVEEGRASYHRGELFRGVEVVLDIFINFTRDKFDRALVLLFEADVAGDSEVPARSNGVRDGGAHTARAGGERGVIGGEALFEARARATVTPGVSNETPERSLGADVDHDPLVSFFCDRGEHATGGAESRDDPRFEPFRFESPTRLSGE